jgi:dihydroneopterin triphosphate diphosphatase
VISIEAGVVDVFVIRTREGRGLEVLAMQRSTGVRCPGSWEVVHGSIEPGESAPAAARREVNEETGLQVERLYSITANPFFLNARGTVQVALVFAAFITAAADVKLSEEHQACEWLDFEAASSRLAWPREREYLRHIEILLSAGNAGVLEDVLLVQE